MEIQKFMEIKTCVQVLNLTIGEKPKLQARKHYQLKEISILVNLKVIKFILAFNRVGFLSLQSNNFFKNPS